MTLMTIVRSKRESSSLETQFIYEMMVKDILGVFVYRGS